HLYPVAGEQVARSRQALSGHPIAKAGETIRLERADAYGVCVGAGGASRIDSDATMAPRAAILRAQLIDLRTIHPPYCPRFQNLEPVRPGLARYDRRHHRTPGSRQEHNAGDGTVLSRMTAV